MKNQIKELRVKIDGLARLCEGLKPIEVFKPTERRGVLKNANEEVEIGHDGLYYNSKEIVKTVDSLYLAKAWLGKCLQELGTETPYKNDGNREDVKDIEPTADVNYSKEMLADIPFIDGTHIKKVDWLREQIKETSNSEIFIKLPTQNNIDKNPSYFQYLRNNVYRHLSEARFHLGFELGRVRKENK